MCLYYVSTHTHTHTHTHTFPPYTYTVPNYLRTKLDLDLEAKQNKLAVKAREEEPRIKDKIKNFNRLLSSTLEKIVDLKEVIEDQKSKKGESIRYF